MTLPRHCISRWEFWVVDAATIRELAVKTVGIAWVRRHATGPLPYSELAKAIRAAAHQCPARVHHDGNSQLLGARILGGAVMAELTQEEALRQAAALVGRALKETEARCAVLGQFINDCESKGSRTSAWSEALRELHALQGYRARLMLRHSLIQQALDCPVGESPMKVPLSRPPNRTALRTQQQVQVRARRRRS